MHLDSHKTPALGPVEHGISQVGILVPNLERGIRQLAALAGAAPWAVYQYDSEFAPFLEYRGAPGRFSMRVALSGSTPQIELIEPIEGPSIYHEWLEDFPAGFHHFGFRVADIATAIGAMRAAGFEVTQQGGGYGLDGDGAFAYFDTLDELGYIAEAVVAPKRRRDPLAVWPEDNQPGPPQEI